MRKMPAEHVWIYDEAQRAWDGKKVREKRGHEHSEPEDFLLIGSKMDRWSLMIGLIGDGQEIYVGEEAGLGQWNDAIKTAGGDWTVHCPPRIASHFFGPQYRIVCLRRECVDARRRAEPAVQRCSIP